MVREADGFMLIGDPDHLDEFSDLVREAAARSGEVFVMPLDWPLTPD